MKQCSVRVRNGSQSCKCSRWTRLATDYEKLTELEQAIAAEQSNQESILDRLVETETELDEMQEKTV